MKEDLFFIDRNRKVLDYPIFKPLLQVLLPALTADAEEIRIGYSRIQPEGISGAYTKNGKRFPLAIEPPFHWGDVFARVKIIAGLSILPEKHQTGEIFFEFNGRVIRFSMETTENENEHTLLLKQAAQRKTAPERQS